MITAKDFSVIAAVLARRYDCYDPSSDASLHYQMGANSAAFDLAMRMAGALATSSPRFDRRRFLSEAGVGCDTDGRFTS